MQNQQPIAKAGNDTTVRLPSPAVLNGTASTDPDGVIKTYQWTKISGPSIYSIANPALVETLVYQLQPGTYLFELGVTDDGGLSAKDTMKVIVTDPSVPNRPPVADAGPDQTIINTGGAFILNGSMSSDPDNNIASFQWTQISGPVQTRLANPKQAISETVISGNGKFQYELTVTDSAGLFSKDTVSVTIEVLNKCDYATRPVVHARLVQIGEISKANEGILIAAAGTKIVFASGYTDGDLESKVDVFDFVQNTWSVTENSMEFKDMVAATIGNKILFAGGSTRAGMANATVHIYDTKTNIWTQTQLSLARQNLAVATAGDKVVFAGGHIWINGASVSTETVDIYDISTNTWLIKKLSEPRSNLTANTVGDKIYFAGGLSDHRNNRISKRIDIFDASTNSWSIKEMVEPRWIHAGVYFSNNLYWAGGISEITSSTMEVSNQVEIRNVNTGATRMKCFSGRYDFTAVESNNKIIFFTGYDGEGDKFDIYDPATDSWTVGLLSQKLYGAAVISVNNKIYVAGGRDGGNNLVNKVWTLEW